ncbi:MAG: porin family protein [Draconibacterium sp.]
MYKNLFILCFLLTANLAFAQRFDAGLIVGFNGTQVEGDAFKGYNKVGLLAGVFVQTDVAPAITAGMEIKYSQKGSRRNFNPKTDEDQYIMRLGYVEIPVFLAFRTNDKSMIIGGISPGVLIHSREIIGLDDVDDPNKTPFKDFDLQPFVGFQFDFLERMSVDLRFALSVVPIRNKPEATTSYWLNNQFNNVISLALYYRL